MKADTQARLPALAAIVIALLIGSYTHWLVGLIFAAVALAKIGKTSEAAGSVAASGAAPDYFADKDAIMATPADIQGHGGFNLEVVGESHYRIAIYANVPAEFRKRGTFRLYRLATLVEENDNEHDANAIAVKMGATVGHLPRAAAKSYRKWAEKNGIRNNATCRAVIVGRSGASDYGIWLDHPNIT